MHAHMARDGVIHQHADTGADGQTDGGPADDQALLAGEPVGGDDGVELLRPDCTDNIDQEEHHDELPQAGDVGVDHGGDAVDDAQGDRALLGGQLVQRLAENDHEHDGAPAEYGHQGDQIGIVPAVHFAQLGQGEVLDAVADSGADKEVDQAVDHEDPAACTEVAGGNVQFLMFTHHYSPSHIHRISLHRGRRF